MPSKGMSSGDTKKIHIILSQNLFDEIEKIRHGMRDGEYLSTSEIIEYLLWKSVGTYTSGS